LFTQIVGAIIDFVLNLVLIPRYGASAAAAATMIAELIIMILQIHILHIEGIWLKGNLKLHKILLSSLVAVLLSVWVKCGLHMSPFYTLLFSSVLFFAGYCSCLYLMKDDVFRKACKDLLNMVSRKLKG
jgi:O-antigen/teichoic acid export membrane protein